VWCGSPLSQGLTRAVILDKKLMKQTGDSVRDSVWDSVGDSVRDSVRASVGDSVGGVWASMEDAMGDNVEDSVGDSVRDSVRDSVWASVWDSVLDSVGASARDSVLANVRASVWERVWDRVVTNVGANVRDSVGDSMRDSVYGAHDAGGLALYRYFHDAVGLVDQTTKLSGLWELARSAGWALPHRNICWVSERHHILSRDDRGRLHGESGPAVAYPDGWAIYAVHGVRVPGYVFERPAEISVERIDGERNAEIRRVMIDRYRHGEEVSGHAAFVRDAGGERLDHDERFGTLWRRNVPDDEPIVMIEVVNSTRESDGSSKRYWLRVPPNMTTAHEAVAWTFNVPAKDYDPKVET
jgi:hypothetical protein